MSSDANLILCISYNAVFHMNQTDNINIAKLKKNTGYFRDFLYINVMVTKRTPKRSELLIFLTEVFLW